MSDEWKLYRVTAKVRPLPWHPKFYDWQFGFLMLWLFANSLDDAAARAMSIMRTTLPYEQVGDDVKVETDFQRESWRSMDRDAPRDAEETGLAVRSIGCVTGADETGFETLPFP